MSPVAELAAAGVGARTPLALVIAPGLGVAVAWADQQRTFGSDDPVALVRDLQPLAPRWTWWSSRETAGPLVASRVHVTACWDLAAVGRLLFGTGRDDPGAVWAAVHGLDEPARVSSSPDLLEVDDHDAVDAMGQLSHSWLRGRWAEDLPSAARWAQLACAVQLRQEACLNALPDPRPTRRGTALQVLTAHAESAAALLGVELEHGGLPVDRDVSRTMLTAIVGPCPVDATDEAAQRAGRDAAVLRFFPHSSVDLRNPLQVKQALARIGIDLPDTRSWRLEPYAPSSPAVAALLAWRKAERIATTYGWRWLEENVGTDGRLRGAWGAADAAAGRMTAQAGLHNLPTELRATVRAEPGHVFVRADLGQVEPRVLAAVSGDPALAAAAREDDLYAPVAAALRCDRPTAKVAVLAAMYGQTSGTAGAALRDMDRTYPSAMRYLRAAEAAGRAGTDIRTYGGRLLRLSSSDGGLGYGRYARNAVVQGAAAELFKAWAATVRVGLPELDGEIVLCLHDELLLHMPRTRAEDAGSLLVGALQSTTSWWASGSGVRFVAEVAVGASWSEAH